jgi:hypothetical protein
VKSKNDVTEWDRRGNAVLSAGADGGQAAGDDFRPTMTGHTVAA